MRRGLSLFEVLVACLVMAVLAIPFLEVFQSGIRDTKAGMHELRGTNLAAEIVEQIELVPFEVLRKLCGSGAVTLSSAAGTLKDGAPISRADQCYFHLSTLPGSFRRSLTLRQTTAGVVLVEARVEWRVGDLRDVSIMIRRALVDESVLPGAGDR